MADQQFKELLYTEYDEAPSNPEFLFSLWTVQTAERLIRFSPDLCGGISRQQDYRLLWQGDGVCSPDAHLKSVWLRSQAPPLPSFQAVLQNAEFGLHVLFHVVH